MKARKIAIGALLVIIGLPVVLVLIAVVWIRVLDRTNGTIVSSGQKRDYLFYVPRSYDPPGRRRSSSACMARRYGRPIK